MCLLAAAATAYVLPWVAAPSASMTLGAYDLAEWVSLHPSQRHTSPPLQASLLLRLQLVLLCLLFSAASANAPRKLIPAFCIVLLAIGQLPPPEFIKDLGNSNYRQQFALALTSLIAGLIILRVRQDLLQAILLLATPAVGIITSLVGMSQAFGLTVSLLPAASTGLGAWLLIASYAGCFASRLAQPFQFVTIAYRTLDNSRLHLMPPHPESWTYAG